MKITLRKRDSVTSIILFLFNLYGEYSDNYKIKLKYLIEMVKKFDKSEASIRMGLSRMVKADLLTNQKQAGDILYQLTDEGRENIDLWNKGWTRFFNRYKLRYETWDHEWCFLSLLDFNKSEAENQFLLEELEETGWREIDNNVWISPYQLPEDINQSLLNKNYDYLSLVGTLETNLTKEELLTKVFVIKELKNKYADFLENISHYWQQTEQATGSELLPILFKLGWDFYDLATSDPALPQDLLADWVGDTAVEEMKQLRAKLYQELVDYWQRNNI